MENIHCHLRNEYFVTVNDRRIFVAMKRTQKQRSIVRVAYTPHCIKDRLKCSVLLIWSMKGLILKLSLVSRVPLGEHDLFTLPEFILVGFTLLSLQFSLHCLYIIACPFFWPLYFLCFFGLWLLVFQEEFEDIKGAIRIRISKKNRQHNGQKKKYKRTNNDQQSIHIKLKIE